MKLKEIALKSTWWVLTALATFSVGILASSGALLFSSSFLWCLVAFILAGAYESQVNGEGIQGAFDRMSDKNYLRLGIVERHLDELLPQNKNNLFFTEYKAQKNYIAELTDYIDKLNHQKASYLYLIEREKRNEISLLIKKKKQELKKEKKRLRKMGLFYLKNLEPQWDGEPTAMEQAAYDLADGSREELLQEMKRKASLIKFSWLLATGAGISSGLATLSAIKTGIIAFSFLSVIPGGALIGLCVAAAIGYTLLVYRSMSDMIQTYNKREQSFFSRRVNEKGEPESRAFHVLRCVGAALAIGLGIFATFTTAGTWWYAAKQGAAIVGFAETAASVVRSVSISLMVVPTFIFNTHNSVESVDKISRSNYLKILIDAKDSIVHAYRNENIIRFLNPFRAAEKIVTILSKSILCAHTISIGLSADRVEAIPAAASTSLNAGNELLTDLNFMPDAKKEKSHHSIFLKALFLPIVITVTTLKVFSACWDYVFSSPRDLKSSFKKMFCTTAGILEPVEPVKPVLSPEWRKQELIETCDKEKSRLLNLSLPKANALLTMRRVITDSKAAELSRPLLEAEAVPLATNRYSYWKQKVTKSQRKMDLALDNYFGPKIRA